ncbi:MAG: T9SS type A sorting domain-containing protein [Bacteroidota bacterium]|jgi:hypothetical protein
MKRTTGLFVLACVCLLFLATFSPMQAQTNFATYISCTDSIAGDTASLAIGVNSLATYGIDSTTLGEKERPPLPPAGVFDVRLVDPRGNYATGQGLVLDLRPFAWVGQYDTFEVDIMRDSLAVAGHRHAAMSWASHIDTNWAAAGGTHWRMVDAATGGTLLNVNMANQTSATIPLTVTQVWIIKADNSQFGTFCYETMAADKDQTGKGATANKAKAITVKFSVTKTQLFAAHVDSLVGTFNNAVYDSTLATSPFTTIASGDTKHKVFKFSGATVDSLHTFSISGIGQKGAVMKLTLLAFYHGAPVPKKGKNSAKVDSVVVSILQLPEPDITNVGAYAWANTTFATAEGLIIGDPSFHGDQSHAKPKDSTYYVYHAKWADVQKSLVKWNKTVSTTHSGTSHVFYHDLAISTGFMKKAQKSLLPDKNPDPLFAEALTLKVNILFSGLVVQSHNLGNVVVTDTGNGSSSLFIGKSISQISAEADTFLTHGKLFDPAMAGVTIANFLTILHNINCVFQGPLDTVSWSCAKPLLKPSVYIAEIPWLERNQLHPSMVPLRQASPSVPVEYTLYQNYPNPFNPTTTIEFKLPASSVVTVTIFNMLGQEVVKLADHQQFAEGINHLQFDAARYASGVYFYRLLVNDLGTGALKFQQVRKMMLVK